MLISIVYDSGFGHTAKIANAIAAELRARPKTDVHLQPVRDAEINWESLEASDAIIFGSPTYNGSISAKLKQFFEDSTGKAWTKLKWRNKVAAGFTNSGANNGDKLSSLITMALFAAQHGMIWVGLDLFPADPNSPLATKDLNRMGSWLGAMAQSENASPEVTPGESDLMTAAYLGLRVADIAQKISVKGNNP